MFKTKIISSNVLAMTTYKDKILRKCVNSSTTAGVELTVGEMLIAAGMLLIAIAYVASMDDDIIELPHVIMEWLPQGIMFYGVWYYRALGGPFIELKDDGFRLAAKVKNKVIGIYIDDKIYAIYTKNKNQIFLREYGTSYTHDHRIISTYLPLFAVYTSPDPDARKIKPHLNQVTQDAMQHFLPNRGDPEVEENLRANRVNPGVIGPSRLNQVPPGFRLLRRPNQGLPDQAPEKGRAD